MIVAVGINSRSSSNRFGPTSMCKLVMPVRLPPGRFRLATSPIWTGSLAYRKDDRNGCSSCFGRFCRRSTAARRNHVYPTMNQFGCKRRQSIILAFRPAIFDRYILALYISCLFQSLVKRTQAFRVLVTRCVAEETNYGHCPAAHAQ